MFGLGEHENRAVGQLVLDNLDQDMRTGPEPVQADRLTVLYIGQPQCTISNHTRTQQRSGLRICKSIGEPVGKLLFDDHVLCIAAVGVFPGPHGLFAQIFLSCFAEFTCAACPVKPSDADTVTDLKLVYPFSFFRNCTDDLMAGHYRQLHCQTPLCFVQIRMTCSAYGNFHKNFIRFWFRLGNIRRFQTTVFNRSGSCELHRFH